MGYERVRIGLLVIASLMTTAYARAQGPPDPWYGRQANPKNIDPAENLSRHVHPSSCRKTGSSGRATPEQFS